MKTKTINKNQLTLNGKWKYVKDANEKFSIEQIKSKLTRNKNFEEMSIPTNWQLAGLNNFNGAVWFIKEFYFDSKDEDNDLKILKFLGVDYFADVWLNWTYLGHHEGYFQPFRFFINDAINENTKNLLVVKVTSPFETPGKVWPDKKKNNKRYFCPP